MSDSKQKNTFGKQTADAILQLYLILIGLGFGFGLEELLKNINIASILRFLAVAIMLVEWLHGQIGYGLSETYGVKSNWIARVTEHYIEIAAGLILLIVCLALQNPSAFYGALFASYCLDLVLEYAYLQRLRAAPSKYKREKEVSRSWLVMDIISVITMSIILAVRKITDFDNEVVFSSIFLLVVLIIAIWDYSHNRDFYFGLPLNQ